MTESNKQSDKPADGGAKVRKSDSANGSSDTPSSLGSLGDYQFGLSASSSSFNRPSLVDPVVETAESRSYDRVYSDDAIRALSNESAPAMEAPPALEQPPALERPPKLELPPALEQPPTLEQPQAAEQWTSFSPQSEADSTNPADAPPDEKRKVSTLKDIHSRRMADNVRRKQESDDFDAGISDNLTSSSDDANGVPRSMDLSDERLRRKNSREIYGTDSIDTNYGIIYDRVVGLEVSARIAGQESDYTALQMLRESMDQQRISKEQAQEALDGLLETFVRHDVNKTQPGVGAALVLFVMFMGFCLAFVFGIVKHESHRGAAPTRQTQVERRAPETVEWRFIEPSQLGEVKSVRTKQAVKLQVTNKSQAVITFTTIGFEGHLGKSFEVMPGQSLFRISHAGHAWLVNAGSKKPLFILVAGTKPVFDYTFVPPL